MDLKLVLKNNPKCLESRSTLRSLLKDMYPTEKRTIHVLLDAYESGVVGKFRGLKQISEMQMESYITQLVDEYGLQRQYAQEGIEVWAKALNISLQKNVPQFQKPPSSSQIKNTPGPTISPIPVPGAGPDYKLKDLPDGSVEIESFCGFEQAKMVIPNMINGKRVQRIGGGAFKNCTGITDLSISNGVEHIGECAFQNCTNIETICFSESITTIGPNAFWGCKNLKQILLPSNLRKLGDGAFRDCRNLESVKWASTVIASSGNNTAFNRIKNIRQKTFHFCKSLNFVELCEGLENIEKDAFRECSSLKSIVIPQSVTSIDRAAFDSASKSKLTIVCYRGSEALRYARENGFKVADAAICKN